MVDGRSVAVRGPSRGPDEGWPRVRTAGNRGGVRASAVVKGHRKPSRPEGGHRNPAFTAAVPHPPTSPMTPSGGANVLSRQPRTAGRFPLPPLPRRPSLPHRARARSPFTVRTPRSAVRGARPHHRRHGSAAACRTGGAVPRPWLPRVHRIRSRRAAASPPRPATAASSGTRTHSPALASGGAPSFRTAPPPPCVPDAVHPSAAPEPAGPVRHQQARERSSVTPKSTTAMRPCLIPCG